MQSNSVFKSVQMSPEIDKELDMALTKLTDYNVSFNAFARSAILNECAELDEIGAEKWMKSRTEAIWTKTRIMNDAKKKKKGVK